MFYIFHSVTKEFLKETVGQADPLNGGFFTPANSTITQPPGTGAQQKAVWNTDAEQWMVKDDNRKSNYWNVVTKDKVKFNLGDSISEAMTDLEPPADEDSTWNGSVWEVPLATAKTNKYETIYAYADSIIAMNEATFFSKGNDNPARNRGRLDKAQSQRTKKKTVGGGPLNVTEQAAEKRYDSLMDWADSVYDIADLAQDAVELLDVSAEVEAYDVATIAWPIWMPPV